MDSKIWRKRRIPSKRPVSSKIGLKRSTEIIHLEKDIHKFAVRVLREEKKRNNKFIFFHVRNEMGTRDQNNLAVKRWAMGVVPGIPDLIILSKNQIFFLELKSKVGKLNKAQQNFRREASELLDSNIYHYFLTFGMESTKEILEKILRMIYNDV